jgi:hypothetical protein
VLRFCVGGTLQVFPHRTITNTLYPKCTQSTSTVYLRPSSVWRSKIPVLWINSLQLDLNHHQNVSENPLTLARISRAPFPVHMYDMNWKIMLKNPWSLKRGRMLMCETDLTLWLTERERGTCRFDKFISWQHGSVGITGLERDRESKKTFCRLRKMGTLFSTRKRMYSWEMKRKKKKHLPTLRLPFSVGYYPKIVA